MKHSVLIIVGSNLVYQHAPLPKPNQGSVELLKDYTIWQQTVKSYLIKEEDKRDFDIYFTDEYITNSGEVSIPNEIMEIYFDVRSGKNYARLNKNVTIDTKTNKVVGVKKICKVCESELQIPIEEAETFFPICTPCLADLKTLVLEKRTMLNLQ
jgi:hypothetical protein